MFDIGIGEILILAVVGLLIFGPERLPRAAADGAKMLRNVKAMASNARKDLADSAGVDLSDAKDALRDLQELHPKRLAASFLSDDDVPDIKPDSRTRDEKSKAEQAVRFDPDAT